MQSSNTSHASVEQGTKGTNSDLVPVPPGGSNLLLFNLPACAKWVFASILFVAVPVYKRMLKIEGVLEKDVIDMAEVVKKVAKVTEKVSTDVAEALPADCNMKKIAIEVEGDAEVVCTDVEKIETFIHKEAMERNLPYVYARRAAQREANPDDEVDDIKDESEAWLDKIVEEWELIMPDECCQK